MIFHLKNPLARMRTWAVLWLPWSQSRVREGKASIKNPVAKNAPKKTLKK